LINKSLTSNSSGALQNSRSSWKEIIDCIKIKEDFKTLFFYKGAKGQNIATDNETYAQSLLYDQFARRIPRKDR
jgi:hypothetical protein